MNKRDLKLRGVFLFLLSSFAVANSFAGIEDKILRFSTPGTDCYADGTPVVDGECYALVWSPKDSAFGGFNADGTPASDGDRVVFAAPLARGGKCRSTIFQIPNDLYAELEGGEWSVCLVDTRRADGTPAGVAGNAPRRVNRWGLVSGDIKTDITSASSQKTRVRAGASATTRTMAGASATGVVAGVVSSVPESVPQPQITSVEVADGKFRVAVSDTVPYLTYTLKSGADLSDLAPDAEADLADGDAEAEIEIETPKAGERRFFKVIRAE